MKRSAESLVLLLAATITACGELPIDKTLPAPTAVNWNNEIIYHVMPRSFYDSDGDRHGDLAGFVRKLPYLQELGVTTILFTPLYESELYHNYFPTDYEAIDPEYGTMDDYIAFVKAVHAAGMKFVMDMETQYAMTGHRWFDESYQNPDSEYSDFILYLDDENEEPLQIVDPDNSGLKILSGWPDKQISIVCLDLAHPRVKHYMSEFFAFWIDPDGDGQFDDGVDGFRIDHIMDDLDNKGILTNLYAEFWEPILERSLELNPNLLIVGEQADWGDYGDKMVAASGANAAFGFHIRQAIAGGNYHHTPHSDDEVYVPTASVIHEAVNDMQERFGNGTYYVSFLENHDTIRVASNVRRHAGLLRVTAVLNLTMPGIPSIYFGQELGVTGERVERGSDTSDLGMREAFPWKSSAEFDGFAGFYRDTADVWASSIYTSDYLDEISLDAQVSDVSSLWHHYRELVWLRRNHDALRNGDYVPVDLGSDSLIGFDRSNNDSTIRVVVNASNYAAEVDLTGWSTVQGNADAGRIPAWGYTVLTMAP